MRGGQVTLQTGFLNCCFSLNQCLVCVSFVCVCLCECVGVCVCVSTLLCAYSSVVVPLCVSLCLLKCVCVCVCVFVLGLQGHRHGVCMHVKFLKTTTIFQ